MLLLSLCKSLRGLKSHQRSCQVIKGLNEEMVSTSNTETDEIINDNLDDFIAENLMELNQVLDLLKQKQVWKKQICISGLYYMQEMKILVTSIFPLKIRIAFTDILQKPLEQLIKSNYLCIIQYTTSLFSLHKVMTLGVMVL